MVNVSHNDFTPCTRCDGVCNKVILMKASRKTKVAGRWFTPQVAALCVLTWRKKAIRTSTLRVYRHVKLIQTRRGSLFYDLSHFNTSVASSRLIMIITWEPSTASRSLLVKKNISTERETRWVIVLQLKKSRTLRSSFRCFWRKVRRRPFVCALLLLIMQAKDKWMRRHKKRTLARANKRSQHACTQVERCDKNQSCRLCNFVFRKQQPAWKHTGIEPACGSLKLNCF